MLVVSFRTNKVFGGASVQRSQAVLKGVLQRGYSELSGVLHSLQGCEMIAFLDDYCLWQRAELWSLFSLHLILYLSAIFSLFFFPSCREGSAPQGNSRQDIPSSPGD